MNIIFINHIQLKVNKKKNEGMDFCRKFHFTFTIYFAHFWRDIENGLANILIKRFLENKTMLVLHFQHTTQSSIKTVSTPIYYQYIFE